MNEKIKAISKNDLTWHENADDTYRIKIEDEDNYHKLSKQKRTWQKEEANNDCLDCKELNLKLCKSQTLTRDTSK